MREHIIASKQMKELYKPEIVSIKMESRLKKYSRNLKLVRESEKILSSDQKKIFHIDKETHSVLGNIKLAAKPSKFPPWARNMFKRLLVLLNFIISVCMTSFKVRFRGVEEDTLQVNELNERVDQMFQLDDLERRVDHSQKSNLFFRVSILSVLKLLFLFKFVYEVLQWQQWKQSPSFASLSYFVFTIVAEIRLKLINERLESYIGLDLNYIEREIFCNEPSSLPEILFEEAFKDPNSSSEYVNRDSLGEFSMNVQSIGQKSKERLIHELNAMRVSSNVKKDFVMKYFTGKVRNLQKKNDILDQLEKSDSKVVTAYRNENLMHKQDGQLDYKGVQDSEGNLFLL